MRFISIVFLSIIFLANSAWAEAYYIELSRAGSEAEAVQVWADLQGKNKILTNYDVFPNAILQPDGSFAYRVQAGPMLEKAEAQNVCNKLYRRKISCFVIEGFDPQNVKSFESLNKPVVGTAPVNQPVTQQDFVLPWLAAEPVASIKEEPVIVVEQPKPEVLIVPEAKEKEAQVEVAEAIVVPLTDNQTQQEQVTIAEPIQIATFEDSKTETKSYEAQASGWLSVQPFLDGKKAQDFWRELQQASPSLTRNLATKIVKPVVSHDIPKVILSIGSFENEAIAMQFCKDFITSASDYLECSFNVAPPAGEGASTFSGNNEAQPVVLTAPEAPEEEENSLYWVEVLNTKTQDEALSRWETIRTDNDDLLSNVRSQIVASLDGRTRYKVRIGPLNQRSKAENLCKALGARRVACKIASL